MPSRRVLITGGSGFVGQWMCRRYVENGWSVFAGTIGRTTGPDVLSREQRDAVCWLRLDMQSEEAIGNALERSDPERVVHLAGIAFPPEASAAPAKAFEINALGALHLLSRLSAKESRRVRVLVVGSAEQYGVHPAADYPIAETALQEPLNVYAASKAAQELIALQIARSSGLHVICTRSFNHSGFGHGPQYLFPAFVERARVLPRRGGTMVMGNGAPIRDYLHVADVVAAYDCLLESGAPGEAYNVSSGQGTSVRRIAERVLKRLGVDAEISVDPALVRASDPPMLIGDNSKLRAATGWAPRFSIDDIIDDLIHAKTR